MPADTLTLRQINRATLARQFLLARERKPALAALERLVGMQAQWPKPPFIGLWSRLEGFERAQLASLFTARDAVRATFVRATIHVVTTSDFLTLRPAIQPVLESAQRGVLRERLDGLDLDALIGRARELLGGGPKTFEALRDGFLRTFPKGDERAMGYTVRMLLPLVLVPEADAAWSFPAQACFASAEQWLKRKVPAKAAPPDALIQRYLAGYGPSSAADVQAWSGLPRAAVQDALTRLRPELRVFRDPGKRELFDLPDAPRPNEDTPAPVRLVPEYDNLITTRADERFVPRSHRPKVFLSALRIAATVLVDGFAVATWKLAATKKTATLIVEPFGTLTAKVRKEIEAEAAALATFAEPEARAHEVTFSRS